MPEINLNGVTYCFLVFDNIPTSSVDYVFMSDALLFYFTPVDPEVELDIQT